MPGGTRRTKEYRDKSALLDRSRWELYIDNSVRAEILKIAIVEGLKTGEAAEALLALGINAYASGNAGKASIESTLPKSDGADASNSIPPRHRFKLHKSEVLPIQGQATDSQVDLASSISNEEPPNVEQDWYRFAVIVHEIWLRSKPIRMDREKHRIGVEDGISYTSGEKFYKPKDA